MTNDDNYSNWTAARKEDVARNQKSHIFIIEIRGHGMSVIVGNLMTDSMQVIWSNKAVNRRSFEFE